MVLVHGDIQASPPLAVALAVLAEHQPVGVRLLAFVPEQCQRYVLFLQFPVDICRQQDPPGADRSDGDHWPVSRGCVVWKSQNGGSIVALLFAGIALVFKLA